MLSYLGNKVISVAVKRVEAESHIKPQTGDSACELPIFSHQKGFGFITP